LNLARKVFISYSSSPSARSQGRGEALQPEWLEAPYDLP
jgi:hypothetical protein